MSNKRWGLALKKNVVEDDLYMSATNRTKNSYGWPIRNAKIFRKFDTRTEAREVAASWPNPVYIVDLESGVVVR